MVILDLIRSGGSWLSWGGWMEVVRVGEWCLGAGPRRAGTGLLDVRKMESLGEIGKLQ